MAHLLGHPFLLLQLRRLLGAPRRAPVGLLLYRGYGALLLRLALLLQAPRALGLLAPSVRMHESLV